MNFNVKPLTWNWWTITLWVECTVDDNSIYVLHVIGKNYCLFIPVLPVQKIHKLKRAATRVAYGHADVTVVEKTTIKFHIAK